MKKLFALFMVVAILHGLFIVPLHSSPVQAGNQQTYIVLYKQSALPSSAFAAIKSAGGSVVYTYPAIGVAIVKSDQSKFAAKMRMLSSVQGVAATTKFAIQVKQQEEIRAGAAAAPTATYDDPYFPFQWDMVQIHVPEAHAITLGDPSVLVGDIDTGLDYTHPDLAANVDFANSVSCLGGVPDQDPAAWNDEQGHGTHTAGTIAALKNDIGVVGVAPGVRIAGIRAGDAEGYFFPEAVICAFMWAGSHHMDVTNNSYFVDPWLFNCRNDAEQRAIWEAERRAIRYAMQQGVTVVAAAGNENIDLAHPTVDVISPDYPPDQAVPRTVTNACAVIPAEIPGVITVSGVGLYGVKTFYSDYGVGVVNLTAPAGDWIFQNPDPTFSDPDAFPFGLILSTVPPFQDDYALYAGTSMAAPHVAGVAALVISKYGKMSPGAVKSILERSATPLDCPANPFDPAGDGSTLAVCQGGSGHNGFYGSGLVDAYRALTVKP